MVKKLVEYIVKELAQDPNSVVISIDTTEDVDTVMITVSDRDRGRVIGKRGQTIKALRSLVDVMVPANKKVMLRIAE
jgi:predicted RNA-binding protein YlqC (UPF0109 family)